MATPGADSPHPNDDRGSGSGREPAPHWVKVAGVIVGVLVVLVILVMVFGGGDHGPGRHMSLRCVASPAVISTDVGVVQFGGGYLGDHLWVRTVAA